MSTITDVKCVLSQRAFDVFCEKFHIPKEVHPILPNRGNTIHERPVGKIRLYTRFFDFANFRLPLSTFLVDILRYFRINISQLSVIGAAKVSHFEILCRVHGIVPTVGLFHCFYVNSKKNEWMSFIKRTDKSPVCYTKPLDSLKNWNDHFFWVDEFACPARFLWHTAKNVTRDPTPVADDFNAQDYATLVAHPSSFWKFPEEFLCLVGLSRHYTLDEETYPSFVDKDGEDMDIFAFIRTTDPTKVKVAERERREDEPRLLETTVGRTVPLLPVAPDRGESELDVSVDKLFDDGGSGTQVEQGDSAGGGDGQDTVIQPVTATTNIVAEDVIPLEPRCLRLFAGAVQNAEVRGEPLLTLPFVTSSVSATPEHEDEGHTDSVTGLNLRTINAPHRFVISSDPSHHYGANTTEAEVDSFTRPSVPVITAATTVTSTADPAVVVKEKVVKPSFGVRTVIDPDTDLQKVYVPRWSVTNGSHLDDGRVCREMMDDIAPPKFFASVLGMEHDQLFTEFNVGAARQMSLSAEVRMCVEYNIKEKRRLMSVVDEKDELLKVREREIENLKAQLLLKEAEVAEAIRLHVEASKFEAVEKSLQVEVEAFKEHNTTLEKKKNELDVKVVDLATSVKAREQEVAGLDVVVHELKASSAILQEKVAVYEDYMGQLERFQDEKMKVVNDKFDKLYTDFIKMDLHLEERFYPHLLTTIVGRRWLLTYGMELAVAKCLNLSEYLSTLGAAIGKAIKKGMQDGLATGITHGKEGRVLADVDAYNPSAEVDYVSALQQLQSVNFSLLTELKLNKDSSVETLMNILHLEETLAERLGLNESQPHVDQLMVPIHQTKLSLVLLLSEPFSVMALEGPGGTSKTMPTTADTTTALSTTFASDSTIIPISVDDYDVAGTDNQAVVNENIANNNATGGDVNPFPNVDDVELNVPE
ncbi:hypothetical protein Tco_1439838 [Tanacetum coccineum]